MHRILGAFLFILSGLFADCTIVFVHIGKEMPQYLEWSLKQARLFNDCRIVLIANKKALDSYEKVLQESRIDSIACESLERTADHERFFESSPLDRKFRGGFWYFASERFFYLDEFMKEYGVENVVHLESDVMLYVDLRELEATFLKEYPGLGVTFDTDMRCIPGLVFIKNRDILSKLTSMMASLKGQDDMFAIGLLRDALGKEMVKTLPIVHKEYVENESVLSKRPSDYANLVDAFHSLFDAAYHGHYLGGEDPRNGNEGPGFINPHCLIKACFLQYSFEEDAEGRVIPFARYGNNKLRINNLHIHCKRLWDFYSKK